MTAVVEASGLRKTYRSRRGRRRALDGLDLVVEPGGVHGFLGPNGSGKTTTLRVLLGLVRADGGSVSVLGRRVPDGLPSAVPRVGALIEGPQLFPGFSGRRNLALLAGVAGLPRRRVDETLDVVGLTDRADDRVKGYSLGMRQRLGIAAALLKEPELLVFDEPTNGLDPAGMREVRELLRHLGRSGVTVLLSSHLLGEVAQVCDAATIVSHGRTVASGAVRDLLDRGPTERRYVVAVPDAAAAMDVLLAAGVSAGTEDGRVVVRRVAEPSTITRVLGERGIWLSELREDSAGLEDVFLALTGEPADGDDSGLSRGAAT